MTKPSFNNNITTKQYIADLRSRCQDKSYHDFVDAIEHIVTEFEKPREPVIYVNIDPTGEFFKQWHKALTDYLNE